MLFNSIEYLCFLFIIFAVYYIIPRKQWIIILLANILFYISFGTKYIVYIIISILTTYISSLFISEFIKKETKNEAEIKKKTIKINVTLFLTITINLVILGLVKYCAFFANSINSVFEGLGISLHLGIPLLVMPIGISFYTFQMIGYLVDVQREVILPERNILKYAVFSSFFPMMISGPISRYRELNSQLYTYKKFDYREFTFGVQRILYGLLKKIVVSDRAAILVNNVLNNYQQYEGLYLIIAAILWVIQLYTDFSGCMDIALGSAQILQIKLPENFKQPFSSKTVSEFWRRWHITLGLWLKDYLFYPLLKSNFIQYMRVDLQKFMTNKKAKNWSTYAGMLILWFTVGLWHGASWNYVIGTGVLHCFYIVLGELASPLTKKIIDKLKINIQCYSFQLFRIIRTCILVGIGDLILRMPDINSAIGVFKNILKSFNIWILFDGSILGLGLDTREWVILIIGILIVWFVSHLSKTSDIRDSLSKQNLVFRWVIYMSLFIFVYVFGLYGPDYIANEFIYLNF